MVDHREDWELILKQPDLDSGAFRIKSLSSTLISKLLHAPGGEP